MTYVTRDSSSDDESVNKANVGLQKLAILPVSVLYGEEGMYGSSAEQIYQEIAEVEGIFLKEPETASRDKKYEGKSYTGYSIAYLQEVLYDGAVRSGCESFMDALDSAGFQGDIAELETLYSAPEESDNPDEEEKLRKEIYEAGYNRIVTDEEGTTYFAETKRGEDEREQVSRIADRELNVLYREETQ
ncbi:MAG: hypothetical protein KH828_13515 [Clostridiales bacterium]|nr:hypothetical protein [Clostridiales bacterium]